VDGGSKVPEREDVVVAGRGRSQGEERVGEGFLGFLVALYHSIAIDWFKNDWHLEIKHNMEKDLKYNTPPRISVLHLQSVRQLMRGSTHLDTFQGK